MSWSPLAPPPSKSTKGSGAFPVTMHAATGVKGRKIMLTIRASVRRELPWLSPGQEVSVLMGAGEHASMLRVTPGGPFRVLAAGGRKDGTNGAALAAVGLRFEPFRGMSPGKHPAEAVEHGFGTGWLEITLPEWARPPKSGPAPAAPAPARKAPFATAATTGPDPFRHMRRGSGPVPTSSEPLSSAPRAARTPT